MHREALKDMKSNTLNLAMSVHIEQLTFASKVISLRAATDLLLFLGVLVVTGPGCVGGV